MAPLTASILIVEDDELNCELLQRRLEAEGYVITTVSTGVKALALIKQTKFDLVLLDIMLPDINGVAVLESIRKDSALDSTQVIMVTANSDREMVLKCIEAGAIDYLIKPFSMHIVKLRIWRCLKNTQLDENEKDIKNSKILLVDDQELNRDVLGHRLTKSGYQLISATNGQEALDAMAAEKFDLILLDIMMPDISGTDVLKKIRKEGKNKNTPVIMTTAVDDIEIINECMKAGADDYITKPLNTTLLKLRILSCLHSQHHFDGASTS